MYCFIPFLIMFICNIILIYQLVSERKFQKLKLRVKKAVKRKRISISIMLLTTFFMISTLPIAYSGAFLQPELYSTKSGILAYHIFGSISFSYHSCNFVLLLTSNKQFRIEFKNLMQLNKKDKVVPFTITRS